MERVDEPLSTKSSIWIGTRYNLEDIEIMTEEYIRAWHTRGGAKFCNGQVERCPTTGRLHVQFKLWFKDPVRKSKLVKFDKIASFTKVGQDNSPDYAVKEKTRVVGPWQAGEKPVRRNNPDDWEEVKQNAIAGNFDLVPADVYVRHFANLQRIHAANLPQYEHHDVRGYWLVGKPGTGKTHFARHHFGNDIFVKAQNKWWDGYKGQKIVVLDDLDIPVLGHYIKIWADKWACSGEIKGATVALQHSHFIITSNYSIQDLWNKDEDFQVREAIARRFQVITFTQVRAEVDRLKLPMSVEEFILRGHLQGPQLKAGDNALDQDSLRVLELGSQGSVEDKNQ